MSRPTPSEAERQAQRERKRAEAEELLDELMSQEGWQAWLRLRRGVHDYSWTNQVLLIMGAFRQGFAPSLVKPASRWRQDGYHPAKGTRALYVWAPHSRLRRDATWACCRDTLTARQRTCPKCARQQTYFRLRPVFDTSQVASFDTGQAPPTAPPQGEPIGGDQLGWMLEPLAQHAVTAGWAASVSLTDASTGGEGGWFDHRSRHLAVCATDPDGQPIAPNARLRVLLHELAHAQGIGSHDDHHGLSYAEAEVCVECVSYLVAASAGLDTAGEAIPYLAGWGGDQARQTVRRMAALIDATAKTLEEPLLALADQRPQAAPAR
ncbi:MAG: hypothetical protein MSC31_15180 [Solirubrobacteraceae bacterium MAG38_C4-C5]|nr:hypothetical protein [Candidatus Siliceabacter maunaloa]